MHHTTRHCLCYALFILTLGAILPSSAAAQHADPTVSVGLSTGPVRRGSPLGYQAMAAMEARLPLPGLRLRVEGLWADWGVDHLTAVSTTMLAITPSRLRVRPYLLAGAGVYGKPGNRFERGWSLGTGLRLSGFAQGFNVESRLHGYFQNPEIRSGFEYAQDWRYVWMPISFGVQF